MSRFWSASIVVCAGLLVACGKAPSIPKGFPSKAAPGGATPVPAQKPSTSNVSASNIQLDEIKSYNFSLNSPLSFASADQIPFTELTGDKSLMYSLIFKNQERVQASDVAANDSYCEVSVTSGMAAKPREVEFDKGQKFLLGTVMQNHNNQFSDFTLVLQGRLFQQILLRCQNVADSAGLKAHIGHIFDLTSKTPPTPPTPVPVVYHPTAPPVVPAPPAVITANDLGTVFQFTEIDGGRIDFAFMFSNGNTPSVSVTFGLNPFPLVSGHQLNSFSWRLWDIKKQAFITNWKPLIEEGSYIAYVQNWNQSFSSTLADGAESKAAIDALNSGLYMVFSINSPTVPISPTNYVDLAAYCKSNPESFINAEGGNGCDTSTPEPTPEEPVKPPVKKKKSVPAKKKKR